MRKRMRRNERHCSKQYSYSSSKARQRCYGKNGQAAGARHEGFRQTCLKKPWKKYAEKNGWLSVTTRDAKDGCPTRRASCLPSPTFLTLSCFIATDLPGGPLGSQNRLPLQP